MEVKVGKRDLEGEENISHQLEKIFMAWAEDLLKLFCTVEMLVVKSKFF